MDPWLGRNHGPLTVSVWESNHGDIPKVTFFVQLWIQDREENVPVTFLLDKAFSCYSEGCKKTLENWAYHEAAKRLGVSLHQQLPW